MEVGSGKSNTHDIFDPVAGICRRIVFSHLFSLEITLVHIMAGLGVTFGHPWRGTSNLARKSVQCRHRLSYPTSSFLAFPSPFAGPSRPLATRTIRPHPSFIKTQRRSIPLTTSIPPRLAAQTRIPLVQSRHDSTSSPTTSPVPTPAKYPLVINHPTTAAAAPTTSLLERFTSALSLTPVEAPGPPSEAGHGSSSVAKLVELARPEGRQLSYAVGLVSNHNILARLDAGLMECSCWSRARFRC